MISLYSVFWAFVSFTLAFYIAISRISTFKVSKPKKVNLKDGDYQVVVVINKDLGMTKGKVLSQYGHAIDSLHEKIQCEPELLRVWRNNGSAKITLKGTQDDINKVYYDAKEKGILFCRIYDAGRTQVKAGSNTAIVVGPATKQELQSVTGYLSLY